MSRDGLPIEVFVSQSLSRGRAHDLTSGWRIDNERLEVMLCNAMSEMGIFVVYPDQVKVVFDTLIHHLTHSPDIQKMVQAAQLETAQRGQTRHAD